MRHATTRVLTLAALFVSNIVAASLGLSATAAAGQDAAEGTPATAETTDWDSLRRPLDLPELEPGAPCPRTEGTRVSRNYGFALGDGPAYPAMGSDGVLNFGEAREEGGWFYQKVLWAVSPDYTGPILVRGHQLDGPNELRFDEGADPPAELRRPAGEGADPGGWRGLTSYTRLRAPGCYAYQVDGLDFSEVIVFQAVEESPRELTPLPTGANPLPDGLRVSSGVRLEDDQVRLALLGGKYRKYLVIRLDVGPTQTEPLDLPSGDVKRLDTEAGTALWEADPEYEWPRVAVWDDDRHRYRLEVLDGDRDAWSEEDLVTLVEAFAEAEEPSAGS